MPLGAKQHTECTAVSAASFQSRNQRSSVPFSQSNTAAQTTRTQSLFSRPQCFRGAGRAHYQQAREFDAGFANAGA